MAMTPEEKEEFAKATEEYTSRYKSPHQRGGVFY